MEKSESESVRARSSGKNIDLGTGLGKANNLTKVRVELFDVI